MDDAVRDLARAAGIANDWVDAAGQPRRVTVESLRMILAALDLPCTTAADLGASRARLRADASQGRDFVTATAGKPIRLLGVGAGDAAAAELVCEDGETRPLKLAQRGGVPVAPALAMPGYHRLRFAGREVTLAVAPPRCITCQDVAPGERMYGLAVQLYGLRRQGDGGIGDTTALGDLAASLAREGADSIALSPTHALFAADPSHYGPYSPSSRLFLNPLLADPASVLGADRVAHARAGDDEESGALIDWPRAARAKYALLRRLFADFASSDLVQSSALAHDYRAFVRAGGDRLREHALFEALHQSWFEGDPYKWDWRSWPPEWRAPNSKKAAEFAQAQPSAIELQTFLQWIATRAFAAAQNCAREAGMRIGLISDLAVGMNPGGSHAWSRQQDLLLGLSIGAPPDLFNPRGQDWGLTGFSPQALIRCGFEPFIATLRAALRHSGGVRIDHAMGLSRLWLVPQSASPIDGAYLAYPLDDMLRLIALESHRHRAIVIGEDLGTVQPEFRRRIAAAGIAGMDVLWFQRNDESFFSPARWRRDAVAMTSTHDLPTVAGWWSGADIATRSALGLVGDRDTEADARAKDRSRLWRVFRRARVAPADEPAPEETDPAVDAALAFTAQSPGALALIPVEDVLGLTEQPNLPGTIDEHPNWRRRLARPAADLLREPGAKMRLQTLRGRSR